VTTCIRNGLVCLDDRIQQADVLVRDGRIVAITDPATAEAGDYIDATGAFVLPGMIDVHTHIDDRIGSYQLADDYRSGTRVAVENGITTIATFVTETTDKSLTAAVDVALQKASGNCYADHWWHLTPIRFDLDGWDAIEVLMRKGFRLFKFYTTYRQAGLLSSYDHLEWIFEKLAGRDVQFLIHCEDDDILAAVHVPREEWAHPAAHARSRPPQAEMVAVREVLRRAERHQAAVHIVHVSTPGALELIEDARPAVRVTCETCPQYLFLDESWLRREDGHRWICSPPLRSSQMRMAMEAAACHGGVDLFATDHCAFSRSDKDGHRTSVREVPNGIAGIGALPHLAFRLLAAHCSEPMLEMAKRLSTNPAKLLGAYPRKGALQPGADADLVVMRVGQTEHPVRSSLSDVHETYAGMTSGLEIEHVLLRGAKTVLNGCVLKPEERSGRPLWPV
jgi:dihydropyrimidinase